MAETKNNRARRFIAGVRCPNCGAEDTLYFVDDTNQLYACIDCKQRTAYTQSPQGTTAKPIRIVDKK